MRGAMGRLTIARAASAMVLVGAGVLTTVAGRPALAEIEVISARGTAPKVGTRLADDVVFDIPSGTELKLLKQPGAETYMMVGPYKGTLKQYVERCSGLFSWFAKDCDTPRKTEPPPSGGTRGIRP